MAESVEQVDLVLTPEQKEKLKGFLPIKPDATFKYVPKVFRDAGIDKKLWPVFILKGKDGIEISKALDSAGHISYDQATGKADFIPTAGKQRLETLEKGIIGWKNYRDADGSLVEFKGKESIKFLPDALQTELQNAINERSELSQEELQGLE